MAVSAVRRTGRGIELVVRLVLGAPDDTLVGIETASDGQERLVCRLRAASLRGRAQSVLGRLIADAFDAGEGDVRLLPGPSRVRRVEIDGPSERLEARLARFRRPPGP